jgi:hypothetical protein
LSDRNGADVVVEIDEVIGGHLPYPKHDLGCWLDMRGFIVGELLHGLPQGRRMISGRHDRGKLPPGVLVGDVLDSHT